MNQIPEKIKITLIQITAQLSIFRHNISHRKLFILWGVSILPALIIFLQVSGFLAWETRTVDLSNTEPLPQYAPHAYITRVISPLVCRMWVFPSSNPIKLFEDGALLPHQNSSHMAIGEQGLGRYSFWNGDLYFSSSDNSDPRSNGRTYQLALPVPVCSLIRLGFYFLIRSLDRAKVRNCPRFPKNRR